MKRRLEMAFGAECRAEGSVRFRLWAPAARRVELSLEDGDRLLPLTSVDEGWFALVTDQARAGTRYKYRIDGDREVPDPASRFQPHNVHGPSEVIDPASFEWRDETWRGRPWEEAVIYELHVGAFSRSGTFAGVKERLEYLVELGITAIELMPLSDFPGLRNWGYDGVLPFAPDSSYGRPENLKDLIQSAHALGLMVFLDVVYNHFGPEGNYLGVYAPQFFTDRHKTPWGNGINFDGAAGRPVRDFFINNALYWLTEFNFDGLRLDAVNSIVDDSTPHILDELAATVRSHIVRTETETKTKTKTKTKTEKARRVHLVLENDKNQSTYLQRNHEGRPLEYDAQWNDDIHHVLHVLATGEKDGYYSDYSAHPLEQLGRCLVSGFAYQGDASPYRNGEIRGEATAGLPLSAFVSFLQNHDQIGNRAFGERIRAIAKPQAARMAAEIFLLAPSIPMLFMGEEFGAQTPFLFFCDFEKDLAEAVSAGRRNEFVRFLKFNDPGPHSGIPEPNSPETFNSSRLDWSDLHKPQHKEWLELHRELIRIRRERIAPRMSADCKFTAGYEIFKQSGLAVHWRFSDGAQLALLANPGAASISAVSVPSMPILYASKNVAANSLRQSGLPPWSIAWFLQP